MVKGPVVVTRARGDAEITPVSVTTEVRIPWLNYLRFGQVLMHLALIPWALVWLLWARRWAKQIGYWRWLVDKWLPWLALNWTWVAFTLILCWVGPSVAYSMYLLIEIIAKRTPAYTPWPSEWGIWRPQIFRRFDPESEGEETEEMEAGLRDVNVTISDGRRKRVRTLPALAMDRKARKFYRAIVGGTATFSERAAKRYRISPNRFRQHIREPLRLRGMAEWKDEENHMQGVTLFRSGIRTLEALSKRR